MKNEAEVCSIITRSNAENFFSKIPDPSGNFTQTSVRVFDGIGRIDEKTFYGDGDRTLFVCWEAKHLKGMSAFAFSRVEPHQDKYLYEYGKCNGVVTMLIVGVSVTRGDNRMYVFDYDDCGHAMYESRWSIHKKYLEKLPYNKVTKGVFKFENIIRWKDIIAAYNSPLIKGEILAGSLKTW